MCGRFVLTAPPDVLAGLLGMEHGLQEWFDVFGHAPPRYNIAPGQQILAVRHDPGRDMRVPTLVKWGLVPVWAKDKKIGNKMINARSETAAEKPSFRAAMKYRRCLVPADGFYEWQRIGKLKQPTCIRMRDDRPFAFAGLWERWQGPDGEDLESCALLTCAPNRDIKPIHDRMPVILEPEAYETWLDPGQQDGRRASELLKPYPDGELRAYPVSARVNVPANDDVSCLDEVAPPAPR